MKSCGTFLIVLVASLVLLANPAIVLWHFYHVIFDPDVYPVNFAFLDGRVSEEHYREEHELAYEEGRQEARNEPEEQAQDSQAQEA
jgi:prepilin-type processing-associated H-X9-DG protein